VSWNVEDDERNPSLRYSLRVHGVGLVELDSVAVRYTSYMVEDLTPGASYWLSVIVHSSKIRRQLCSLEHNSVLRNTSDAVKNFCWVLEELQKTICL